MVIGDFSNENWGKIGKIPAESDFFSADLDMDDVIDGNGFTMSYSKLIGEQVFKLTEPSEHPFTARLTGAPIRTGAGWIERLVKRMGTGSVGTGQGDAKSGMIKRKNPKDITADDDLRYYDSAGKEFVYQSETVEGWIPVSLPSGLDIYEMFNDSSKMGMLNSLLVDNVKQGYDNALESQIQTYAVNMCPKYEATTKRGKELYTYIRDTVSKMRSDDYAYNFMSAQDNKDYEHKAKDVIVFMNRIQYNAMMDEFADLHSPDFIKEIGAEMVLLDNGLPTPYASINAMTTDGFTPTLGGQTATASVLPMIGKDAPELMIMDKRWVEYRPIIDSYRVNISKNGAGDFVNEHLHYKGGINAKPWANAVAIKLTDE